MKSSKIEEELQGSPRTFVSEVGPVTSGPRGWRPKSGGQDSSFAFPGDPFEFQRQPGVIMSPSLSAYSRTSDSGRNRGGAQRQKVSYGYRRREDSHRSRSRSPVQARSDSPLFISDNEEGDEADDDKNDEHDEDDDAGSSFSLDPNEAPNPEPISERAENNCICPISLTCPARENNLIDCRTLVVEKQWWIERTEKTVKSIESATEVLGRPEDYLALADVQPIILHLRRLLEQPPPSRQIRLQIYASIQEWLTKMFTLSLNTTVLQLLESTNILHDIQASLGARFQIFRRQTEFPISLEEELTVLSNKWSRNDGNMDPYRGLLRVTRSLRLDKSYPQRRLANVYGHNGLVNGQRWNKRIQMIRDGAHSELIAGICGNIIGGAYAVVMGYHNKKKKDYYADIDIPDPQTGIPDPNKVYYYGTARKRQEDDQEDTNIHDTGNEVSEGKATLGTQILKASLKSGNPVRLFRPANQAPICAKRPDKKFGKYRYDGLYQVTSYRCMKKRRQIYRFRMVRLLGQNPIRDH